MNLMSLWNFEMVHVWHFRVRACCHNSFVMKFEQICYVVGGIRRGKGIDLSRKQYDNNKIRMSLLDTTMTPALHVVSE
jgi:hypothetical protein